MEPSADLQNTYERVKLRIYKNNAYEIIRISSEDPINRQFFAPFGPQQIVFAEIHELHK